MNRPMYINVPMPSIILHFAPMKIILSNETAGCCATCGQQQVHQNDNSAEETEELFEQEADDIKIIRVESVESETMEECSNYEEDDFDDFLFSTDVDPNLWSLSSTPDVEIKSEPYDWEQFFIE